MKLSVAVRKLASSLSMLIAGFYLVAMFTADPAYAATYGGGSSDASIEFYEDCLTQPHWVWGWILGMAVLSAGLALATAFGLYERASWGRGVAIVAAIFALIHPLLGTILGVYTLVLMLSGDAAEQYNRLVRR